MYTQVRIVADFLKHTPPGEFNEVFNDIQILLNNDGLLKEGAAHVFAQYNMEQFILAKIDGFDDKAKHGVLRNGRFVDPHNKISLKFDHLWRDACESALKDYIAQYYPSGVCTVVGMKGSTRANQPCFLISFRFMVRELTARRLLQLVSRAINLSLKTTDKSIEVHYYEDGNVQLVNHKDIRDSIIILVAIGEHDQAMSDTFKALHRQLPVTHTKVDWTKILSYKIGKEMQNA
ncbi:hypothetical protein fugu_005322 [Takifugu bimaculatus]|uniref:F-actin-capping protein subunit alpha n=1 Tax=Takifugu bimaculatus TaxID=433685 RepID=A0A4Z2BBN9_9TELE|nr:hypothetical protein fugu_005322 [Takifugu bimaculatus]